MYISTLGLGAFALSQATGRTVWAAPTGYDFDSPAVADGVVYTVSPDHLLAIDSATGAQIWSSETLESTSSSAAIARGYGLAFIGTADGYLRAIDLASGATRWQTEITTDDGVYTNAAVANGVVYVTGRDDRLSAVDALTGNMLGQWLLGSGGFSVVGAPTVVDGSIYATNGTGQLFAFGLP